MTVETFFEKFEVFADAPNAIENLRVLVLELAMLGRLVDQRAEDEAAPRQLDRIATRRAEIQSRGRRRATTQVNKSADESAAPLPSGWAESTLGDLVAVLNGRAYAKTELLAAGTPVLRVGNLFTSNHWYYSDLTLEPEKYCDPGDLLFAWSASFGPFIWSGPRAIYHYHIWKLELYSPIDLDKRFLYWFLQNKTQEIKQAGHGVSMVHMTKEKMERLAVPLPPLAEQKRIVAKVDELMALCDRLEAQQQERAAKHADLARAAVARFADEPTPANLEFLFHPAVAVDISDIRKSVLAVAVQGRLVSQASTDEPVGDLLERVADERGSLNRKQRVDPACVESLGYGIPESWRWVPLDALLTFGPTNGISPKAVEEPTPVRSLTLSATTSGRFKGEHSKFIAVEVPPDDDLWLRDGDILVQRGNTPEYVGVSAIYRGDSNQYVYPDLMMKLRVTREIDPAFVHLAMSEEHARDFFRRRASGTTGTMPKINQTTVATLPIPIPPLAEQRRIVAKVDQLMALIDRLEAQLAKSRTAAERLMEAVVAELTRSPLDRDEPAAVEEKPDPAAARIAAAGRFACYVVRRLHDDPEFGRTKLEKCNHLAESHCGVPLDRHAIRGAHGPVDYVLLKDAERWAEAQGGFITEDPGDGGRVAYKPGPSLATHVSAAEAWLGERKAEVDRLIDLLRPLKTRDCELLATVYVAWNDLLLAGQSPNDRDILRDAKHNWHAKKETISDDQWFRALRRLEHHGMVPSGKGRPVPRRI